MNDSNKNLFLYAGLCALLLNASCLAQNKPNSYIKGVQIGAITYSWRSLPCSAEDIIVYCQECDISSIELMGNVAEEYAGIPPMPPRIDRNAEITEGEAAEYREAVEEAREKQRQWRTSVSMKKYRELGRRFRKAGIDIHTVKFSPARWSDEETDYAFIAAKAMGARAVSNEIGHQACKRLGEFAEKHEMYAVFHNHLQPAEPGFSLRTFLKHVMAFSCSLSLK